MKPTSRPGKNRLLASLPAPELRRIEAHLEPFVMKVGEELHGRGGPSQYVYFPLDSVTSLVVTLSDGATVEAATVGCEGMVGLPLFIDSEAVAIQALTQVSGTALRMKRSIFKAEMLRDNALCHLIHEYTEVLLLFIAQSCACNNIHSQRQRCARWLLLIQDRVGNDTFAITQSYLAMMLGVRRATVTNAAGVLREAGRITYRKGIVQILDRKGLESEACECYTVVQQEFEKLKSAPG